VAFYALEKAEFLSDFHVVTSFSPYIAGVLPFRDSNSNRQLF